MQKCKYVGFRHMVGTSKRSGNPYDFYVCHFLVPFSENVRDCAGYGVAEFQFSRELFERRNMKDLVGSEMFVYFNQFGRVTEVEV